MLLPPPNCPCDCNEVFCAFYRAPQPPWGILVMLIPLGMLFIVGLYLQRRERAKRRERVFLGRGASE